MDQILDPVARDDGEWEDCVFDEWGRAYCTENPWLDPGVLCNITQRAARRLAIAALSSDTWQILTPMHR